MEELQYFILGNLVWVCWRVLLYDMVVLLYLGSLYIINEHLSLGKRWSWEKNSKPKELLDVILSHWPIYMDIIPLPQPPVAMDFLNSYINEGKGWKRRGYLEEFGGFGTSRQVDESSWITSHTRSMTICTSIQRNLRRWSGTCHSSLERLHLNR